MVFQQETLIRSIIYKLKVKKCVSLTFVKHLMLQLT